MAIEFTKQQQKVIDERNKNILVAAAAGSGKTAVLVERIISLITDKDHPVDIDRMLIVTFTNAAAAQMRERIYQALVKKQEEKPDDANLARQATLLHNAMITTIHKFCLFLIHNHFNEIGLDPAFRMADEGEISLMKEEIMSRLMEEKYAKRDEGFLRCKEAFAPKVKDRELANMIDRLAGYAMSYPWPIRWLEECKAEFEIEDDKALGKAKWMQIALQYAGQYLEEDRELLEQMKSLCDESDGPYMYVDNVKSDMELVDSLLLKKDYESLRTALSDIKFQALSRKKDDTVSAEKRESFKGLRDLVKKDIKRLKDKFFFESQECILDGISKSRAVIETLIDLAIQFINAFDECKREKNVIDFNDMEHFALRILIHAEDNTPTETALAYREYFEQIMIDEYQDSNMVQELLLSVISREDSELYNNRFMVGDIKQSIYKFRLARPEIFLEKYHIYANEKDNDDCVRIDLSQNFRSRKEVIDSVNMIFHKIMTESVGGVCYDDKAALHAGAQYSSITEEDDTYQTELLLYEEKPDTGEEENTIYTGNDENDESEMELMSKREKEAAMVAGKIKELVGKFDVTDEESGELRKARYHDIVILLRSNKDWDEPFKKVLGEWGIPVHLESKTGYFAADEIQSVMNYLRVLSNPYHDIALTAMLTSYFGGMDEIALSRLRLISLENSLYDNLLLSEDDKCIAIRKQIERFRELSDYMGIYELLSTIMREYHYLEHVAALPDGEQRKANVEMLMQKAVSFEQTSYHGLYSFIHYMEKLQKYDVDYGEADITEETADAVRIMTIHKSKGLEFPICFMAGLGKKINLTDLTNKMLMDIDLGIAVPVINCDKRVRTKSIKREIMAHKMKLDSLGEELRVLYVGLTRAKEKLFLCASVPNYEKLIKANTVQCNSDGRIVFSKLASCSSHLSYIICAVGRDGLMTKLYHDEDIRVSEMTDEFSKTVLKNRLEQYVKGQIEDEGIKNLSKKLQERFSYQYPYSYLAKLYTKTSVSELKHAQIHEDNETNVIFETDRIETPYLPEFMKHGEESSGVMRGSAYHRVLELIDYKQLYSLYHECCGEHYGVIEKNRMDLFVEEQFETIRASGKMAEEIELVYMPKIAAFLSSYAGYRMARAAEHSKLYKEQPFVMAIDAKRVVPEIPEGTEKVLIQGIIDVFFYETDTDTGEEQVIVLDYKTDRVNNSDELRKRYQVQLDYYAEALSKMTGKSVKEKLIYGFHHGEELSL